MSLKTTILSIVTISLLSAGVASAINSDKILFVDVRTRAEINLLGMPQSVDVNIPYMSMDKHYCFI